MKWMWADAKAPLGLAAAKLDPLRWTSGAPEAVAQSLEAKTGKDTERALFVRTKPAEGEPERLFLTSAAAAAWVCG